jgi:hypothetical protein
MTPQDNVGKEETPATAQVPRPGDLPIREHMLMVNDLARGQKYYEAMKAKIR